MQMSVYPTSKRTELLAQTLGCAIPIMAVMLTWREISDCLSYSTNDWNINFTTRQIMESNTFGENNVIPK
ncbi:MULTISPECIES: hypothetical protein [Photorhabdus]|uniref:hypothetical protein n=1 Tax=Photorhabdus TaxID=29487 RepID=UPI001301631C|nr:hypothetical protein [Photorhabdus thracensis]MCC8422295.1 hypothetical protein [Photorhabdus thracensis]